MTTRSGTQPAPAAGWRQVAAGLALGAVTAATAATGAARAEDGPVAQVGGQFLDEGFEGTAAFPPPDWSYSPIHFYPHTWHSTTEPVNVHRGLAAAKIEQQSLFDQNELLITPLIDLQAASGEDLRLSFWYRTDPFWFHGVNTVFHVHGSLDGMNWSPLFRIDDVPDTGWAWRNVVVDLAAWAGQSGMMRVRFTYHGQDAADLALDDVRVGYLEDPAPPANDNCATAAVGEFTIGPSAGPFQVAGNSYFALPDYGMPLATSCTGHAVEGRDLVWRVQVPPGHRLVATMNTIGDWDDSLFLLSDCGDPPGSCVAGDRGFPDGAHVAWGNPEAVTSTLWLVASGWGSAAGEFVLDGVIEPTVSLEAWTWGRIKAVYRENGR